MKMQAKAVASVLRPVIKGVKEESADQLDLIQDLQDRVNKLEALVATLAHS
ncbi:hypothetical protein [Pseudomonas syringae]|uniref:hypothetical protein n=1 Tax=Pseudomonas syringae TaxID=317 RepID=UPI0012FD751E|nr:hypothetical protein [Pseudomonas syringae]